MIFEPKSKGTLSTQNFRLLNRTGQPKSSPVKQQSKSLKKTELVFLDKQEQHHPDRQKPKKLTSHYETVDLWKLRYHKSEQKTPRLRKYVNRHLKPQLTRRQPDTPLTVSKKQCRSKLSLQLPYLNQPASTPQTNTLYIEKPAKKMPVDAWKQLQYLIDENKGPMLIRQKQVIENGIQSRKLVMLTEQKLQSPSKSRNLRGPKERNYQKLLERMDEGNLERWSNDSVDE